MATLDNYKALREEIDAATIKLWDEHHNNMACKKGCDKCCLNFDVFPIEFDYIKQQVEENYPEVLNQSLSPDSFGEEDKCLFLKDHQCSIYTARPIICRTHGYPLLYMNEAGDQWELSHCELNFTQVDEDYFNEDNCYAQDTFNSRLFMMNKEYIKTAHPDKGEFDLIPLADLLKR
ncbi:YkgJ family cysteine cluster protein [Carboxylicivirga mesophila]|uniref:YkgJ family cysteine cluster protein n=1 Tax=Carboxylicivirga mesophila TaxID=1166478 RepID=A0ABS5KCP6_9BACT|nr:YkgJ family cysteine cluster protein [Carboxylicivirga mesophila]MBS2212597.1 YkgJ family cysteine cluster protein [Carboxylicivirga mesophila]